MNLGAVNRHDPLDTSLKQSGKLWIRVKRHALLYFLLSFAVIWTFIFCYLPMFGIVISFQDFSIWKGFWRGLTESEWVGFRYYINLFQLKDLRLAVLNTLKFSGLALIFGFPLTVLFALLLNELRNMKFKRVVQTISYLPYFLSWIAVVALIYTVFELYGPVNALRVNVFGMPESARVNILTKVEYFTGIVFWSGVYKGIGWGTVIYLAAISGVDAQLYEAAVVDGCGRFKQVFYITLPSILPTIVILFILQSGSIINANFEQIKGLQNNYTQAETEVINTLTYNYGIQQSKFSQATAFGVTQGIVSFLIMYIVNKITNKISGLGIW